jgi:hypothetical protein
LKKLLELLLVKIISDLVILEHSLSGKTEEL